MRGLVKRDAGVPAVAEPVESFSAEPAPLYIGETRCERCDFGAFDVMHKGGLRWSLACIYCGQRTEGPPVEQPEPESPPEKLPTAPDSLSSLRFREGRYADRTLKETATTVAGVEYLQWYAKSGKSKFMQERVAEFLALLRD
jgi:hypothetical protein